MLENFKNGSSVKIIYTYKGYEAGVLKTYDKELKGLLYKEPSNSNRVILVSDTSLNGLNCYQGLPNVLNIGLSEIKEISSTRFRKEVSDVLNNQYKLIAESKKINLEIAKLNQQQLKLQNELEKSSIGLFNVMSHTNLKDMSSWKEKIKIDFNPERYYRIYDSNSDLNYYFKSISRKGTFVEITFNFCVTRNERLLSKEFEDQIRRDESITQNDKQIYTPTIDRLNQLFKGKVVISSPSTDYSIQDKGWVSFYSNVELTFKVDLNEYDKWFNQLTQYINRYFPKDTTKY